MWQQNNSRIYKQVEFLPALLIIFGIGLRYYYQFVEWSFNGDEVDLGLEILRSSFKDLFYPFQSRQSAPPLFLVVQKTIAPIAKPYISLKIISFLSSCASLLLFNRLSRLYFPFYLQILLLAFFCFNPFIIGNSLTLKQYTLDLTLGLVSVNYFINNRNNYITFIFFSIFCLFSNVGLFFCASLFIFKFMGIPFVKKGFFKWKSLRPILPFLLAPVPYLFYFLWFMQQPGAEEMRNYMTAYWSTAFVPLDFSVFKWFAIQARVITLFLFSSYLLVGVPLFLGLFVGIIFIFKNIRCLFQNKILGVIAVYWITVVIHLALSSFKIYPFSDRLFLYLVPGFYLTLGYGIMEVNKRIGNSRYGKISFYSFLMVTISAIILNFSYLPQKENDVLALMRFTHTTNKKIVFTSKAKILSSEWLEFTKYDKLESNNLIEAEEIGETRSPGNLIIAVQSRKFGHTSKMTTPEPLIQELLVQDKIVFHKRVGGYAIYKVK